MIQTPKSLLAAFAITLLAFTVPSIVAHAEDEVRATSSHPAPAGVDSPAAEVRKTIEDVVDIVEANEGNEKGGSRRAKMREVINPRFDFQEMAKRSLGANWRNLSPDQQKEFTDVFSDLLARTYLSRIETVKRNMVKVDGESVEFPKAVVKTTVTSKGDTFPIDYKLLNETSQWKVYDVVIENIGLVANYRNEFAAIIRKERFEGLMKRLRDKAKEQAQS